MQHQLSVICFRLCLHGRRKRQNLSSLLILKAQVIVNAGDVLIFLLGFFSPVITGFYEIDEICDNMKHNITWYFPCSMLLFSK